MGRGGGDGAALVPAPEQRALDGDLTVLARELLADDPWFSVPRNRTDLHDRLDEWLGAAGVDTAQRTEILQTTLDDLCGAGPMQPLLDDPAITEIMVNGLQPIWVEVDGRLRPTDLRFRDRDQLRAVVERLLAASGRRIDEARPTVDARLADGSRLNAVLPPVAVDLPLITIRRFAARAITFEDLVRRGAITRPMAAFLHAAVCGRANVLVTGCAGAGKTTLLAALAALVPADQRIVSVEDTAELRIAHGNVAALQCRAGDADGIPGVTLRDLVRNSLRMRPDRLIVGEVRGSEAADMVQAMSTGHAGSMATLHANSPEEAMLRLEAMLAIAWPGIDIAAIRGWMGMAIDVVVHCARDAQGRRAVASVVAVEVGDEVGISTVPVFERDDTGRARPCGTLPRRCLVRMATHGVRLPATLFGEAVA